MKTFSNFIFAIATLAVCCGFTSCNTITKKESKPNIILFLVDDMGLMDTSLPFCVDNTGNVIKQPLNDYYRTPNMEKLADQGVRFSSFYAHSVCSPTRVSIMTGQTSARHRTTQYIKPEENNGSEFGPPEWNWLGLKKESVTLPRVLQSGGYKTIMVGKAHFGPMGSEGENPLNLGFDVNIGGSSVGQPGSYYGKDGFGHINGLKKRAVDGLEKYHGQDIFLTEALTLEANAAISQSVEEGKPFFLYMAHYALHAPFHSDPRFAQNYASTDKPKAAKAYATLVEGMDKSLGDIVAHVKSLGLGENTIIIFLGDNGSDAPLHSKNDYHSSEPFRGKKAQHWEGGMRVPFIASWVTPSSKSECQKATPIAKSAVQTQMGTIFDLFPTICKVANVNLPENHIIDGFPLQTQLKNKENTERKEVFLNHFPHFHRSSYYSSLVVSNWKIIYHYPIQKEVKYELFDLQNDPFETTNLAIENPSQLKVMMQHLQNELTNNNALYPQINGEVLKLEIPK